LAELAYRANHPEGLTGGVRAGHGEDRRGPEGVQCPAEVSYLASYRTLACGAAHLRGTPSGASNVTCASNLARRVARRSALRTVEPMVRVSTTVRAARP